MTAQLKYHKSIEEIGAEYELIVLAQQNPRKFEVLYNANFETVFRFVLRRVESKDVASDITQQVFMKALSGIKNYTFKGLPFSAWLYRIALNELSSYYAKSNSSRIITVEEDALSVLCKEIETEDVDDRLEKVMHALQKLSHAEMHLVEMRFFEAKSFKEIGSILQITENNAKVKLYRVISKLQSFLPIHSF